MRSLTAVFLMLFILILLPANAEIKETKDKILTASYNRFFKLAQEPKYNLPKEMDSKNDVWLFVSQAGATIEIVALSPKSVPAIDTAYRLQTAVRNTLLSSSDIKYCDDDNYSTAMLRYSKAKLFQTESTTEIEIDKIISNLKSAGFSPSIRLRVSNWNNYTIQIKPAGKSKHYSYYNIGSSAKLKKSVSSISISKYSGIVFIGLQLLFPLLFIIVIFYLLNKILKDKSMPTGKKIYLINKMPVYMIIAVFVSNIAILAASVIFFIELTFKINDLWFGSFKFNKHFTCYVLISSVFIFLTIIISHFATKKLSKEIEADLPETKLSLPEKKINRKNLILSLVVLIICLALMNSRLYVKDKNTSKILNLAGTFLLVGSGFITNAFLNRNQKKAFTEIAESLGIDASNIETEKSEISYRITNIARSFGINFKEVEIDTSSYGLRYIQAMVSANKNIVISYKALRELSNDELDFIISHELSHIKNKDIRVVLANLFFILVIFTMIFMFNRLPLNLKSSSSFMAVYTLILIILMPLHFIVNLMIRKKLEYKADQLALKETRNLSAAQSALMKIMKFSPNPFFHEYENMSTHPKLTKRIDALRKSAEKIGLPVSDVPRPVFESESAGNNEE